MLQSNNFPGIRDGNEYLYFVNGEYRKSESGNTTKVTSPMSGEVIGYTQACTREEVDGALDNAWEQFHCWQEIDTSNRAKILHKMADLIREHANTLGQILSVEIAKPVKSAISEIDRTADIFDFTAEDVLRLEGETKFGDVFAGYGRSKISLSHRVPLGVILAIGPFNYPFNLTGTKIAPALAAGNCCLVKPPSAGAITTLHYGWLANEAGVPPGNLNIITGRGAEIGDYLVSHEKISMVAFTGSTETGKRIASLAGMIPLQLELGGKDAAIVLPDADLKDATSNIVSGAFSYSGQRCTAVKRVLVFKEIADELAKRITEATQKLSIGKPEEDVVISALISPKQCDFVQGLVDDALEKGAKLLCGNKREGNILWPTVLDHVTTSMRVAWEEPFGPVLPIMRVNSIEDAIEIANKSEYGLQGAIFTQDVNSAINIAMQLEVGTVQVNSKTQRGPDHFPFLGTKSSGLGVQGTKYSIESMSRLKSVVLNLSEKGKVMMACSAEFRGQ